MPREARQKTTLHMAALAVLALGLASPAAASQPNVVLMMVDNYGFGELGVYGGGALRGAETPNLDALAKEGLRLTNFNVETQCTPSRSALMTGRFPIRSGTTKVVVGMLYGLVQWEVTMAEMMREAGYANAMFGKWHLGDTQGRLPTDQGFDQWYGIPNTTDESVYTSHPQFDPSVVEPPFILETTAPNQWPATEVKAYDVEARRAIDSDLVDKTIAFMTEKANVGEPFFAYVPFTQAHLPTLPNHAFEGTTGNGNYADVTAEIDHRAGQILTAIDNLEIKDNTIVIWTADNGPEEVAEHHGTSGFWRGHYFTALEGSLRVPFMIRWPGGGITSGRVSNEMVHMVDLFPTLAAAVGGTVPTDRMIDGVNQLPFFQGTAGSAREGFPVYNGDAMFAYKWKDWKLHLIEMDSMFGSPKPLNFAKLYNLINDPKELFPTVDTDVSTMWVFPAIVGMITDFNESLVEEPPIQLGTPDPYVPPGP